MPTPRCPAARRMTVALALVFACLLVTIPTAQVHLQRYRSELLPGAIGNPLFSAPPRCSDEGATIESSSSGNYVLVSPGAQPIDLGPALPTGCLPQGISRGGLVAGLRFTPAREFRMFWWNPRDGGFAETPPITQFSNPTLQGFLGDHTKTGLGTLLNTGTNIGPFCNVLPRHA